MVDGDVGLLAGLHEPPPHQLAVEPLARPGQEPLPALFLVEDLAAGFFTGDFFAADFLAGVPTMMKSWSHPESESVSSYVGAVINSGILLLTVVHWTTEVVAFPLFILCVCSVQVLLVGGRVGPRLRHARAHRRDAEASEPAPTV